MLGEGGGGLHFADGGMRGAALGGKGEEGDARAHAEQMPGKLRGGDGDVGKLFDGGVFDYVAVGQEENAVLAKARVFHLQHHATAKRADVRRGFDGLERCWTEGSSTTSQSARKRTPFSPKRESSTSSTMQLQSVPMCGAGLMVWKSGRRLAAVIWRAPATKP